MILNLVNFVTKKNGISSQATVQNWERIIYSLDVVLMVCKDGEHIVIYKINQQTNLHKAIIIE